jgi:DNA-binding transcriptional MerR regulator
MQISELVRQSGVPLASVKFYIREGMLQPGEATSATRANYNEGHLQRLRLIHSLTAVAGLPLARTKKVLEVIDAPPQPVPEMLGRAISALSVETEDLEASDTVNVETYPRAHAAIPYLGGGYEPRLPAIAQLEKALKAVEEAGIPATPERLRVYGTHIRAIAESEFSGIESLAPLAVVEWAVLGTTLYEPVIAAIRRLAHQNLANRIEASN